MRPSEKANFLLRRAEEEAILAIRSEKAAAAAAHEELSLLYSERALAALNGATEIPAPEGKIEPPILITAS